MVSILATIDGSPASLAIIPALTKLAAGLEGKITLLTVVTLPAGTQKRPVALPRATVGGGMSLPGGITNPTIIKPDEPDWAETEEQAAERVISEAHEYLESAAQPLRDKGLSVGVEVLVDADSAKAIIGFARQHGIDLIAMATHGRSGLSELVQGSVAAAVVRSGAAPVMLVRPA